MMAVMLMEVFYMYMGELLLLAATQTEIPLTVLVQAEDVGLVSSEYMVKSG